MARDCSLYVTDMVRAIDLIRQYTDGMEYKEFCANQMVVDAVVRNFEVIGEAVGHIPGEMQSRYPAFPWSVIRGFRNILAHNYWMLDTALVWEIIQTKLHDLKTQIAGILSI